MQSLSMPTMRLLTNNPIKRRGLQGYGLKITSRVPIEIPANEHNEKYLLTKKEKFGHLLSEFGQNDQRTAGDFLAAVPDDSGK